METGYSDDGWKDYHDEERVVQVVDGGTEDAGELGSYCESNWDVQVSLCSHRHWGSEARLVERALELCGLDWG